MIMRDPKQQPPFMEKVRYYAKVTKPLALAGAVGAGPYAVDGCERYSGYPEPLCGNLGDAAQNLHLWFGTSTATNSL